MYIKIKTDLTWKRLLEAIVVTSAIFNYLVIVDTICLKVRGGSILNTTKNIGDNLIKAGRNNNNILLSGLGVLFRSTMPLTTAIASFGSFITPFSILDGINIPFGMSEFVRDNKPAKGMPSAIAARIMITFFGIPNSIYRQLTVDIYNRKPQNIFDAIKYIFSYTVCKIVSTEVREFKKGIKMLFKRFKHVFITLDQWLLDFWKAIEKLYGYGNIAQVLQNILSTLIQSIGRNFVDLNTFIINNGVDIINRIFRFFTGIDALNILSILNGIRNGFLFIGKILQNFVTNLKSKLFRSAIKVIPRTLQSIPKFFAKGAFNIFDILVDYLADGFTYLYFLSIFMCVVVNLELLNNFLVCSFTGYNVPIFDAENINEYLNNVSELTQIFSKMLLSFELSDNRSSKPSVLVPYGHFKTMSVKSNAVETYELSGAQSALYSAFMKICLYYRRSSNKIQQDIIISVKPVSDGNRGDLLYTQITDYDLNNKNAKKDMYIKGLVAQWVWAPFSQDFTFASDYKNTTLSDSDPVNLRTKAQSSGYLDNAKTLIGDNVNHQYKKQLFLPNGNGITGVPNPVAAKNLKTHGIFQFYSRYTSRYIPLQISSPGDSPAQKSQANDGLRTKQNDIMFFNKLFLGGTFSTQANAKPLQFKTPTSPGTTKWYPDATNSATIANTESNFIKFILAYVLGDTSWYSWVFLVYAHKDPSVLYHLFLDLPYTQIPNGLTLSTMNPYISADHFISTPKITNSALVRDFHNRGSSSHMKIVQQITDGYYIYIRAVLCIKGFDQITQVFPNPCLNAHALAPYIYATISKLNTEQVNNPINCTQLLLFLNGEDATIIDHNIHCLNHTIAFLYNELGPRDATGYNLNEITGFIPTNYKAAERDGMEITQLVANPTLVNTKLHNENIVASMSPGLKYRFNDFGSAIGTTTGPDKQYNPIRNFADSRITYTTMSSTTLAQYSGATVNNSLGFKQETAKNSVSDVIPLEITKVMSTLDAPILLTLLNTYNLLRLSVNEKTASNIFSTVYNGIITSIPWFFKLFTPRNTFYKSTAQLFRTMNYGPVNRVIYTTTLNRRPVNSTTLPPLNSTSFWAQQNTIGIIKTSGELTQISTGLPYLGFLRTKSNIAFGGISGQRHSFATPGFNTIHYNVTKASSNRISKLVLYPPAAAGETICDGVLPGAGGPSGNTNATAIEPILGGSKLPGTVAVLRNTLTMGYLNDTFFKTLIETMNNIMAGTNVIDYKDLFSFYAFANTNVWTLYRAIDMCYVKNQIGILMAIINAAVLIVPKFMDIGLYRYTGIIFDTVYSAIYGARGSLVITILKLLGYTKAGNAAFVINILESVYYRTMLKFCLEPALEDFTLSFIEGVEQNNESLDSEASCKRYNRLAAKKSLVYKAYLLIERMLGIGVFVILAQPLAPTLELVIPQITGLLQYPKDLVRNAAALIPPIIGFYVVSNQILAIFASIFIVWFFANQIYSSFKDTTAEFYKQKQPGYFDVLCYIVRKIATVYTQVLIELISLMLQPLKSLPLISTLYSFISEFSLDDIGFAISSVITKVCNIVQGQLNSYIIGPMRSYIGAFKDSLIQIVERVKANIRLHPFYFLIHYVCLAYPYNTHISWILNGSKNLTPSNLAYGTIKTVGRPLVSLVSVLLDKITQKNARDKEYALNIYSSENYEALSIDQKISKYNILTADNTRMRINLVNLNSDLANITKPTYKKNITLCETQVQRNINKPNDKTTIEETFKSVYAEHICILTTKGLDDKTKQNYLAAVLDYLLVDDTLANKYSALIMSLFQEYVNGLVDNLKDGRIKDLGIKKDELQQHQQRLKQYASRHLQNKINQIVEKLIENIQIRGKVAQWTNDDTNYYRLICGLFGTLLTTFPGYSLNAEGPSCMHEKVRYNFIYLETQTAQPTRLIYSPLTNDAIYIITQTKGSFAPSYAYSLDTYEEIYTTGSYPENHLSVETYAVMDQKSIGRYLKSGNATTLVTDNYVRLLDAKHALLMGIYYQHIVFATQLLDQLNEFKDYYLEWLNKHLERSEIPDTISLRSDAVLQQIQSCNTTVLDELQNYNSLIVDDVLDVTALLNATINLKELVYNEFLKVDSLMEKYVDVTWYDLKAEAYEYAATHNMSTFTMWYYLYFNLKYEGIMYIYQIILEMLDQQQYPYNIANEYMSLLKRVEQEFFSSRIMIQEKPVHYEYESDFGGTFESTPVINQYIVKAAQSRNLETLSERFVLLNSN